MARLVLIGLAAGFLSALLGVGGGIVVVPLLLFAGFEIRAATATSLGAIAITAAAGAAIYAAHGAVEPVYAALVGIPAAGGVVFGTALQQRVPVRTLSYLFAALLAGIAVYMLVAA
ncbi:MAG TPA: TSUP family transporter [Gaiellaceae bacterium]|nr:TSUP family transporter [Gaiellaceae bacterium]